MIRTYIIVALILITGGMILSPAQRFILEEEKSTGLLPVSLLSSRDSGGSEKLEQQLFFVALGGLRSLVAAFMAVNAHNYFMTREWDRLENRYNQVVALVPGNNYYWDTGSWYLGTNASSASLEDLSLRETERKLRFKGYVEKGRNFLRRGIHNNPDDWFLYARLGEALADNYRLPDYAAAAEAYKQALARGGPQRIQWSLLYATASAPGREREAYGMARKLVLEDQRKSPTGECLLYAYQISLDVPRGERVGIDRIFLTPARAEQSLDRYLSRQNDYPRKGVKEALDILKPYAKYKSWNLVPHSDLEKLSFELK